MLTGLIESAVGGVARVDDESSLIATPNGCEIEISEPGFLYFFANDSAFAYGNNSGFLSVELTRIPWSAKKTRRPGDAASAAGQPGRQALLHSRHLLAGAHIALRECGLDFDLVRVDIRQHQLADGSDFTPSTRRATYRCSKSTMASVSPKTGDRSVHCRPRPGERPGAASLHARTLPVAGMAGLHQFRAAQEPSRRCSGRAPRRITGSASRKNIASRLGYVAARLSDRNYLLGDQFTVADAYLFTVLAWSSAIGMDIARWPPLAGFPGTRRAPPKRPRCPGSRGLTGSPATGGHATHPVRVRHHGLGQAPAGAPRTAEGPSLAADNGCRCAQTTRLRDDIRDMDTEEFVEFGGWRRFSEAVDTDHGTVWPDVLPPQIGMSGFDRK
jgi:glutathione S-transferase